MGDVALFKYITFFSGFIKQGEVINPYDIKTIMMFSLFQLIYTIVTLIPTSLIFNYESINAIYLVIIAAAAVWNGGSYYILIFSQRYNLKFMPKTVAKADSSTCERTLTDKSEWFYFYVMYSNV